MSASSPPPVAARPVAELAKATLRRLALQRLEPTPENYARAYAAESGLIAVGAAGAGAPAASAGAEELPDGEAWAALIERTLRGVERSGRGWTPARRKDSLQRVLAGSRSDARRLHQRLQQLVGSWDDPAAAEAALAPASPVGDASSTEAAARPVADPLATPAPSVEEVPRVPSPVPPDEASVAPSIADPHRSEHGLAAPIAAPVPQADRGEAGGGRTSPACPAATTEGAPPDPADPAAGVARAMAAPDAPGPAAGAAEGHHASRAGAGAPTALPADTVAPIARSPQPPASTADLPAPASPAVRIVPDPAEPPVAPARPDPARGGAPSPDRLAAAPAPLTGSPPEPAGSAAERSAPGAPVPSLPAAPPEEHPAADPGVPCAVPPAPATGQSAPSALSADAPPAWPRALDALGRTVGEALPPGEGPAREIARRITAWPQGLGTQGPEPQQLAELAAACDEARRLIGHRHHWTETLVALCQELTASLAELAEDESWARGQTQLMQAQLDAGLGPRGVRQAGSLLAATRAQQQRLRGERQQAREALKTALRQMLDDIAVLGRESGRYADRLDHHAAAIASADTLEGLAERVRDMVAESRAVHGIVAQTQARLQEQQARAEAMQQRVRGLEDEIRRLSDEVSTDPLTQIANRRGLQRAFEAECARQVRAAHNPAADAPPPLAVGLLDIDNFKRLNDRLGHASGDAALQFLARRVSQALRPQDTLARYGGEEFVVLLPATPLEEARQVLNRLQRMLSAELFASDGEERVFITFSAGVTALRPGEGLDAALARADIGLYEAKRTGKNRSCVA